MPGSNARPYTSLHFLVVISGLAALSWQVLWQVKSTLALGVSAQGAALTLAVTMGGMCLGSLIMGWFLRGKTLARPIRAYAVLEVIIGVAGLLMGWFFGMVERLDGWAYAAIPGNGSLVHLAGITLTIGIPTLCMGATLPVLGLASRQFRSSISVLYGLNTLGAAAGALVAAFVLIPAFGIAWTAYVIAFFNIVVGIVAWVLPPGEAVSEIRSEQSAAPRIPINMWLIVSVTGFATLALEVAWFRSLTAAFRSTTDAFAIMVSCVLLALGIGARLVPLLKKRGVDLHVLLAWGGILILLMTPVIERFDLFAATWSERPIQLLVVWFTMTFYAIAPAVLLLGTALPWILDEQKTGPRWGSLYALNSFTAIIGALAAGWVFLPAIGFARTAWVAGVLVLLVSIFGIPSSRRRVLAGLGVVSLAVAVFLHSGVGETRVLGWSSNTDIEPAKVLEAYEGPEAAVAAVEYVDGSRSIIIDGFTAAQQFTREGKIGAEHYMPWMGHLPMLLHENPKNALVICFGTGQTANAVRNENPESLDIVDVNPRVFQLAHNFTANQNVLGDKRVNPIVMDGRAYMRRTDKMYDIITLEPMPPTFAGVNALYSREFYQFARTRLRPGGVIAQWVPFHILGVSSSKSIVRTFQETFPNAVLWVDPQSGTGILLGSMDDSADFGQNWPGFARVNAPRDMSRAEVQQAVVLYPEGLKIYAGDAEIITDDNQFLAYGRAVLDWRRYGHLDEENMTYLRNIHARVNRKN